MPTPPTYQPLAPIENLVWEGGGVKGIAYISVIEELERTGVLDGVKRVAGSSAGGIIAMLVGLGYPSAEIKNIMSEFDFTSFLDRDNPFWSDYTYTGKLLNAITNGNFELFENLMAAVKSAKKGAYKGDIFLALAGSFVAHALPEYGPGATFRDLKEAIERDLNTKGYSHYKDMIFTGVNMSTGQIEYFSSHDERYLDMPIAQAVRITMSFPGAFEAFKYNGNWYIDGGAGSNCPMEIFEKEEFLPEGYAYTGKGGNPATLGLKIDSLVERYGFDPYEHGLDEGLPLKQYLKRFKSVILSDQKILEKYGNNLLQIYDEDVDTLNFNLSPKDKAKLIASGRREIQKWLDERSELVAAHEIAFIDKIMQYLDEVPIHEVPINDLITYRYELMQNLARSGVDKTKVANYVKRIEDFMELDPHKSDQLRAKIEEQYVDQKHGKAFLVEQNLYQQAAIKKERELPVKERMAREIKLCQQKINDYEALILRFEDYIEELREIKKLSNNYYESLVNLVQEEAIGQIVFGPIGDKNKKINQLDISEEAKAILRDYVNTNPSVENLQELKRENEETLAKIDTTIEEYQTSISRARHEIDGYQTKLDSLKNQPLKDVLFKELIDLDVQISKSIRKHTTIGVVFGEWLKEKSMKCFRVFDWLARRLPGRDYEHVMDAKSARSGIRAAREHLEKAYSKADINYLNNIKDIVQSSKNEPLLIRERRARPTPADNPPPPPKPILKKK